MEPTATGPNRTGAAINPEGIRLMLGAVNDLSPPVPVNTLLMDAERQRYISEAESLGSIPPPNSAIASRGARAKEAPDTALSVLLDKMGERIAFERTGTRLYSALITKYLAITNADGGEPPLPSLQGIPGSGGAANARTVEQSPINTLLQIRSEELGHFRMLADLMLGLGGDPTALTPSADVTAAASAGLMQVVTDPRTTLAQCLNAILTAELTDNAGWELLSELAASAGQKQLLQPFAEALEVEQRHLVVVQDWLRTLVIQTPGTAAV